MLGAEATPARGAGPASAAVEPSRRPACAAPVSDQADKQRRRNATGSDTASSQLELLARAHRRRLLVRLWLRLAHGHHRHGSGALLRACAAGRNHRLPGCGPRHRSVRVAHASASHFRIYAAADHRNEAASSVSLIAARGGKKAPPLPSHCHAGQGRTGSTPPSAPREARGRSSPVLAMLAMLGAEAAPARGCACLRSSLRGG
jgi:hypothetical protein